MGDHPITTAKGNAAVTVILAVVGVFLPFLADLIYAQVFSVIAVIVILWLYADDIREVLSGKGRHLQLAAPLFSILLIAGVAVAATVAAHHRAKTVTALTKEDLAQAMNEMSSKFGKPSLHSALLPTSSSTTSPSSKPPVYHIIVQEPPQPVVKSPMPTQMSPTAKKTDGTRDYVDDLRKTIARQKVGSKVWKACTDRQSELISGLAGLIGEATVMQNSYVYNRDDKKVVTDLQKWITDSKEFFANHKDYLPDYNVIEFANQDKNMKSFLGIHGDANRAWGRIDAKRKVVASILYDTEKKDCNVEQQAAIAQCVEDHTCD